MKIERFEDIEGRRLARVLTNLVYDTVQETEFARDFGLRDQITRAAGSVMHNVAEGFDSGSNLEFIKFLRYAQRSCTEIKSPLYVAVDRRYVTNTRFEELYALADQTHAKIGGFIRYLLSSRNRASKTKP